MCGQSNYLGLVTKVLIGQSAAKLLRLRIWRMFNDYGISQYRDSVLGSGRPLSNQGEDIVCSYANNVGGCQ